jgi:hypothetical protein
MDPLSSSAFSTEADGEGLAQAQAALGVEDLFELVRFTSP